MNDEISLDWAALRSKSLECAEEQTTAAAILMAYFAPAARFVKAIIGTGRSAANGPRPQDHAAVGLSIQAYRFCVASATAALSGYADACPPLNRSIWEIQLRLFDIREAPHAGSLGYLFYGATQETLAREHEIRASLGNPVERDRELALWRNWRDDIRQRAQEEGISDADLKAHGKLSFKTLATAAEQDLAYKTLYARHSAVAHGGQASTIYTHLLSTGAMKGGAGVLLPFKEWTLDGIGDALASACVVFALAAQVLGEEALYFDVTYTLGQLDAEWAHFKMRLP